MDTIVKASWKLLVKLFIPIFLLCLLIAGAQIISIVNPQGKGIQFLIVLYSFLVGLLFVGVVTYLVTKRLSPYKETVSFTLKKYLKLIGAAIILILALVAATIPAAIGLYFTDLLSSGGFNLISIFLAIVSILLFLIPLYLYIRWILIYPAIIVDNKGVFSSFEKSWEVTKGNFCSIVGLSLVVCITIYIALIILFGLLFLIGSIFGVFNLSLDMFMEHPIATSAIGIAAIALYGTFFAPTIISHTLLYGYIEKPQIKEELHHL